MKKLVIIPAIALVLLGSVQFVAKSATNKDGAKNVKLESSLAGVSGSNNISLSVQKRFQQDFGSFPVVKWEKTNSFARATFAKDGSLVTAWYNKESKLVGTSSVKSFSDMPGQVQERILSTYNDYYIVSVLGFEAVNSNRPNGASSWLVELSNGTGKIIVKVNVSGETSLMKKI